MTERRSASGSRCSVGVGLQLMPVHKTEYPEGGKEYQYERSNPRKFVQSSSVSGFIQPNRLTTQTRDVARFPRRPV